MGDQVPSLLLTPWAGEVFAVTLTWYAMTLCPWGYVRVLGLEKVVFSMLDFAKIMSVFRGLVKSSYQCSYSGRYRHDLQIVGPK